MHQESVTVDPNLEEAKFTRRQAALSMRALFEGGHRDVCDLGRHL